MKLFNENPSSRVMVFIDYRNLVKPATEFIGKLDFFRLTQILVGNRELIGAYVFDGLMASENNDMTRLQHEFLREQGFRVIASESVIKFGEEFKQKEVDVALACEVMEHALNDHFDVAIIVSGDRDFVPAIKKVQSSGKRVELAAFKTALSEESKRTADAYHELDKMPIMRMLEKEVDRWSIYWICRDYTSKTEVPYRKMRRYRIHLLI